MVHNLPVYCLIYKFEIEESIVVVEYLWHHC